MMLKPMNFDALWLMLTLSQVAAFHNLEYSDLEMLGVACSPMDTCTSTEARTFLSTNCECDTECHAYNDCCIDAPQAIASTGTHRTGMTCMSNGASYEGVYAINKCRRNWRGPMEVRQKCQNLYDISDPLVAAPATDTDNDITYRNRYCAECNNVDLSQLQSWNINIECDSLAEPNSTYGNISDEYVTSHLSYKGTPPNQNRWGVYYWNSDTSSEIFYPCVLSFQLPAYLHSHVRFCRPNIISTCATNWSRNIIRRRCEAYMAVVYFNSSSYRNPHCALCNNLQIGNRSCLIGLLSRRKPPLSFSLLLDVNMRDGNRVGMTVNNAECPASQKWDPFFKKCRTLVCALRGYVISNGKCVRQ